MSTLTLEQSETALLAAADAFRALATRMNHLLAFAPLEIARVLVAFDQARVGPLSDLTIIARELEDIAWELSMKRRAEIADN